MFTGIVDSVGVIEDVLTSAAGREVVISSSYADLKDGESISVAGACLTVREHEAGSFRVAAVTTTLARTAIGSWVRGRRVNLERALRAGDRIGGHFVQGHVDCVAIVAGWRHEGDARVLQLRLEQGVWDLLVPRGSVAVDGVSLTVEALPAGGMLEVSLIEYTLSHTTLGELREGDFVHIESDMIARHIHRLAAPLLSR